ncbi:MAG: methyltransferase [Verrucomicrobiales bacterium]|nr:methyltransferase [Verrucomicrobiales bacterium]
MTHLVDVVVDFGRDFAEKTGEPPVLLEFGVGCGSLSISVKKELPEAQVIGVDLDSDAIAVARENAAFHHADVLLVESDLFSDLPPEIVPDIVFGDPPWGDDDCIYDDDRPASHYHAMPILSAFPSGGITGLHEAILSDIANRGWDCNVLLNLGILDGKPVERLASMTRESEVFRFDKASVFRGIVATATDSGGL